MNKYEEMVIRVANSLGNATDSKDIYHGLQELGINKPLASLHIALNRLEAGGYTTSDIESGLRLVFVRGKGIAYLMGAKN